MTGSAAAPDLPTPRPERAQLPTDPSTLPELGPGYEAVLADGLRSLGLTLTAGAARAIDAQARLLMAWNQHINLTAIRTPDAIAQLHVLDSLSAVPVLRGRVPEAPAIMDMGSGGGYPGLPLAVVLPAARLTLVDSVAKKVRFLEAVAGAASQELSGERDHVAIEAIAARAEQLAEDHHRESWDVVTVRAVGDLAEVAELGLPLLRRGGLLVCWKRQASTPEGPSGSAGLDQELHDTRALIVELGGDMPEIVSVEVAGLTGHRLVLVHKLRPTPRRFPRVPAERRRRLLR